MCTTFDGFGLIKETPLLCIGSPVRESQKLEEVCVKVQQREGVSVISPKHKGRPI